MHRPSQSGIKNYLNELISYLKRSYIQVPDQIKVETSFDDVEIGIDSMIAVGLIINELFSNSTKYAFIDGVSGSILISFTVNNGHYSLNYQDTGSGFVFPVTDDLLTSSLGVKLINIFTAQLRGTIVNNPTSQGMSITIAFSGKL
ncbi:Blue-light-activated histidine kinase 1 [uncultured bacterium]|nr:Blue-light-activated histidine kinase 1 [uncultured bacterium]